MKDAEPGAASLLRDEAGGSTYLRLSTRALEQPRRSMTPELEADIIAGAYWMRRPGPNAEVVIAYTGALAPEAIEAVGMLAGSRRDIGLLAVTSADRLHAGWTASQALASAGVHGVASHVEQLLAALPRHCVLVTVLDGHPATLAWLGSVHGHRTRALGVQRFGQTGTVAELYALHGIDADAIATAATAATPGRVPRRLIA